LPICTDRSLLAEEDAAQVDPEPEEPDQAATREERQEMNEELVIDSEEKGDGEELDESTNNN